MSTAVLQFLNQKLPTLPEEVRDYVSGKNFNLIVLMSNFKSFISKFMV